MIPDWRQLDIRWAAVGASLLLSVFTLLLQDIPNSDAYTYARTAEIFLSDGLRAAYQHYSWATYSILIGIVSSTGLDVFSAGLAVNSLFYAILVYAYLSIVREIDESEPLLLLSAICILVYPQLNEYRELLIRDLGFWSLSLVGLWQFLIYARTQSLSNAIACCAALLVAASFRAEALAYLALTPLALLLDSRIDHALRRALLVRLYALVVALSAVLLVFLALMGLNVAQLFIEFASIYEPFVSGNFTLNDDERALLGSLLFTDYAATFSREYIELFLLAGMLAILLANLVTALGGPFVLVLLAGLAYGKLRLPGHIKAPVLIYLAINFLILLGFLLLTRYLSSRYAMMMCILLSLFVPITLKHLLDKAKRGGAKSLRYIVAVFLSYCAIDAYYSFGESKTYVIDAIEWLAQNTEESQGLITNNHAVAYFSGKVEDYDLVMRNLSEADILSSEVGDTIAAELTYETSRLLESPAIAEKLRLLVSFPESDVGRIVFFERID